MRTGFCGSAGTGSSGDDGGGDDGKLPVGQFSSVRRREDSIQHAAWLARSDDGRAWDCLRPEGLGTVHALGEATVHARRVGRVLEIVRPKNEPVHTSTTSPWKTSSMNTSIFFIRSSSMVITNYYVWVLNSKFPIRKSQPESEILIPNYQYRLIASCGSEPER